MAAVQIPGVTLFTTGRDPCTDPLAVVLHAWDSGIETLDLTMQACLRRKPACPPSCHTSFHFGIGGACQFHQYVPIEDTAWGFGVIQPTCPEPVCPPDACASCTGLTDDQFQPWFDGSVPDVSGFIEDACGTANSCVIHVAVTNLFPTNQQLGQSGCCAPDAAAYKCLVQSLCDIFAEAGLTPGIDTLLVHCNELDCLDIEQLVADIQACLDAPAPVLPPCTCTPTAASFADLPVGAAATPGTALVGSDAETHAVQNTILSGVTTSGAGAITQAALLAAAASTVLVDAGGGAVTIQPPLTAAGVFHVYIKNIDNAALTVSSSGGELIDGVASISLAGTVPAGYPFGNNGGEAVHLAWNGSAWFVL